MHKKYFSLKKNYDINEFKKYIEKWIYYNIIIDMSYLFCGCKSLKKLPDISKWDLKYVEDISYLFYGYLSLKELPDISKWNTANVRTMEYLFYVCNSLKELPDFKIEY